MADPLLILPLAGNYTGASVSDLPDASNVEDGDLFLAQDTGNWYVYDDLAGWVRQSSTTLQIRLLLSMNAQLQRIADALDDDDE